MPRWEELTVGGRLLGGVGCKVEKKLNPWLCEQRIAILGSVYKEFHSLTLFVQRVFT